MSDIAKQVQPLFPGLAGKTFLDAACVSLTPQSAADGIRTFLDMALNCTAQDASFHHIAMDEMRQEALDEGAALLNAPLKQIALVESTTHGLNIAANAIPLSKGDNILIADTEYLQVPIPWAKKCETHGVEIKPVKSGEGGALPVDLFLQAVDARTRVICVSSVQWCTGYRVDMKLLGEFCREKGIWLVVDAIQEVGVMSVDLATQYADFYIAGGHKWLNAPFGCGLMYVSERVLNELQPNAYGYLALHAPEDGWGEYFRTPSISPYRPYNFPREAKTFEIAGTSNYPGAVGLGKSLKLVNQLGITAIEQHVRGLIQLLRQELKELGARLVSPEDSHHHSGITVFNLADTRDGDLAILENVLKDKVYISMRYTSGVGGIRVSTHYFNSEADIHRLAEALRKAIS